VTSAVLDANVLYSAMLRDLFMRLAVGLVFQPKWTDRIHTEWMENVLKNRPDLTREPLERTRRLMDQWGGDWEVPVYETLIPLLSLPDSNDRHVLAAAIVAQAPVIVTFNLSDFPETTLAPFGIRALHPDAFLVELLEAVPDAFVAALRGHRSALKNPSCTPKEYLARFVDNGLHRTAAWLEQNKDHI
jgi:predicted nucleic acid-binding protein